MQAPKRSGLVRAVRGAAMEVATLTMVFGAMLVKYAAVRLWNTSRMPLRPR